MTRINTNSTIIIDLNSREERIRRLADQYEHWIARALVEPDARIAECFRDLAMDANDRAVALEDAE